MKIFKDNYDPSKKNTLYEVELEESILLSAEFLQSLRICQSASFGYCISVLQKSISEA